jgi:hypothetical protein
MLRRTIVKLARSVIANVFRREVVFLPLGSRTNGTHLMFDVSKGHSLLPLRYDYRATADGWVNYQTQAAGHELHYSLYSAAYSENHQPVPGPLLFSFRANGVGRGDRIRVNLLKPCARLNDQELPVHSAGAELSRKFIAELRLSCPEGFFTRRCPHYLPYEGKPIGQDYYFGDDYVDYPRQREKWVADSINRVRKYCPKGRLLEVGCALGVCLEEFLKAGLDAYGVDISEFAVAAAKKRVGPERVRQCDIDRCDLPFDGKFDALVLFDVLEHSANPRRLLQKVTDRAGPGTCLFLTTSNIDSLTHRLLGRDWEGYTDYSHYGVEEISATTLRAWLHELGWEIMQWECSDIWMYGADATMLRLRDAFRTLPELSTWLAERDLGDCIYVAARKT